MMLAVYDTVAFVGHTTFCVCGQLARYDATILAFAFGIPHEVTDIGFVVECGSNARCFPLTTPW